MDTMSAQNSEGTGQEALHVVCTVGQTISATPGTGLKETMQSEPKIPLKITPATKSL